MGSKSLYSGRLRHSTKKIDDKDESCFETLDLPEDCTIDKIYFLGRHGTRYPTRKSKNRMESLNLTLNMDDINTDLLTSTGKNELFSLGSRFVLKYSNNSQIPWFQTPFYHPSIIDFRSSQKTRVLESAYSFSLGFASKLPANNTNSTIAISSTDLNKDNLLRFHKSCSLYKSKRKIKYSSDFDKLLRFYSGFVYETLRHLSLFAELNTLNAYEFLLAVRIYFEKCQFEVVLNTEKQICQVFIENAEILELMEYIQDAETFFFKGSSENINIDMGCILRHEISSFLANLEHKGKKVLLRFGHAETIVPVLTYLKLFQDNKDIYSPKYNFTSEAVKDRKWRNGYFIPFAANLHFERVSCPKDKVYIRTLLNEEYIDICPSKSVDKLCELDEFLDIFGHGRCNFEQICALDE